MSRLTIIKGLKVLTGEQKPTRKPSGIAPSQLHPRTSSAKVTSSGSHLIAIGASAGGPAALAYILKFIPAEFPAPIVVVQHIDPQFAPALANWLDNQSAVRVRLAEDGELPAPGTVLLAAQAQHLVVCSSGNLRYTEQPIHSGYRPSVDVFFESIDKHWPGRVTGVILTGMGRDGARGLLSLRLAGHHTIVQDEASSDIYGMPKAATELGAACSVLGLNEIGLCLQALGTLPA